MAFLLFQPIRGDCPWVGGDGDGKVEGRLEAIGLSSFRNDDEDGEDDNWDIFPQKLFGAIVDKPVLGLDSFELS